MPNLYAADETEKIVSLVRPLAKAAGKLETRDAILQHYVQLGGCSVTQVALGCYRTSKARNAERYPAALRASRCVYVVRRKSGWGAVYVSSYIEPRTQRTRM